MGVMQCDRQNCENILCHRTILDRKYYICNDCFNELETYKNSWEKPITEKQIRDNIIFFMNTDPGHYIVEKNIEDIDEVFRRLTGEYDDPD